LVSLWLVSSQCLETVRCACLSMTLA
jgi:hypothetical protein